MIDAEYWSLAPHLDKVSKKVKARTSGDYGFPGRTADSRLVQVTRDDGCVLFTRDDNTIKRSTYPPCTHGGIIFLQSKGLRETEVAKAFRHFCSSKQIKHSSGHLTYLYHDHAVIFTHKERIEVRWFVSNRKRTYQIITEPLKPGAPLLL